MKKNPFVISALLSGMLLGCAAQQPAPQVQQPQPQAKAPTQPLGFFVTSAGIGKGADLGGLAGADAHCQKLAAAAGAGNKTWHAYLSTQAPNGQPAINARDRIGTGPWYNVRGAKVAKDVADLHGDALDAARLGNNLSRTTALTEKNEPVKGAGDKPNEHDILTGSQTDGRAFTDAADHTCNNYTSSAEGSVQVGHFDRTGGGNISWNAAHKSRGCSQANLISTGGAGLLYCFALDHTEDTTTPAIADVVAAGTRIEFIKDGFEGTEGPIALPDGGFVFTETRANRITRIAEDGLTSTFLENSNGSNGLAFNAKGELVTVQVLNPRVGIVYPPGQEKVLADQFEGVPFVRPNDLVLSKRGDIYFTDSGSAPASATKTDQPPAIPRPAVYRITPEGKLLRIANDIERPNGIQLSTDEKVLYVANTAGEYIFAYDVAADGSISGKRNFAKLEGYRKTDNGSFSSGADGLAVDTKGSLYVASTSGIQVFSTSGEALGIIPLPKAPQNLAFAGKGKNLLYIVGRGAAYRIAVLTPGFAGRAK